MSPKKIDVLVSTSTSLLDNQEIFNLYTIQQIEYEQLKLWQLSQAEVEPEYPLHTEPLPSALQWWDEERFWLVHSATGLRVPGSWTVDKERRVACGLQLMALAEAVCKRSSQKGGEG